MDRFLVTGAMGFVGSHWCEHLLKQGKTVYGIDLGVFCPRLLEYDNFIFAQDTIKNYQLLQTLVNQVDCVCHFAGIAEPSQYVSSPRKVIDITAIVGLNLVEMCRCTDKLFFFTSTSEIYGRCECVPFKEDSDRVLGSTTTKRWCYSSSKAIIEHYLDACAFSKELNHVTVRLFNVYGPRLKGRVVSSFIDSALRGEDLTVHGNGEQTRCFTYIDDMTDAFCRLINNPECHNQIFNVGNPTETTMNELAETVIEVADSRSEIKFQQHEEVYGKSYEDIPRRVPDISKIQQYTGWVPSTDLKNGLKKTIDFVLSERQRTRDVA